MKLRIYLHVIILGCCCFCGQKKEGMVEGLREIYPIQEVNWEEIKPGDNKKAIVGVNLIDGTGESLRSDMTVLLDRERITAIGKTGAINIPGGFEIYEAKGKYMVPGLIDAHFHLDRLYGLPQTFLKNGITSLRDPGAWIEAYENERNSGQPIPRLFLTGPHFDDYPPAYPYDALIVRDEEEAKIQVNKMADQGASAIKVYFRLPLGTIKAVCEAAHARGLPVTAHLEITDAMEAIEAGVDGIEHVTSLGPALIPFREAEGYRQKILLDNNARRTGRYAMWKDIDMDGPKVNELIQLMVAKNTFLSATIAVYEYRELAEDSIRYGGYQKMEAFIEKAFNSGVKIVVGSHSSVPYADLGWAYHREMEILADCGMSNYEVIQAATIENARFFKMEERLGTIEAGKMADLVLLDENPLEDIRNMRKIHRVVLNGHWVLPEE